jgi:GT2 family glycosyltransferase
MKNEVLGMKKVPKVIIIILNWNGWKDTIECLESLYQINYPNYDVVILDNDSHDGSLEKIKDYIGNHKSSLEVIHENQPLNLQKINDNEDFKYMTEIHDYYLRPSYSKLKSEEKNVNMRLILIENKKNYGFAQGNNIGIDFGLKHLSPDYVLLLNNDTVVGENFLTELVKVAEKDDEIGFLGPKTYFYHEKNKIQAAGGGIVDFKHGDSVRICHNVIDDGHVANENKKLDYIMGSCILVRKSVIEKIGLLDTVYFTYWEDVDWCFRGLENGYKSVYVYKSEIWHKEGTSSPSYSRIYYHTRNRLYFMKQHASKSQYSRFLLYYVMFIIFERLFHFIKVRDLKTYNSMFRGMIDGFRL